MNIVDPAFKVNGCFTGVEMRTNDYSAEEANVGKIWMRTDLPVPALKVVIAAALFGGDILTGGSATASKTYQSNVPANACNDNPDDYWYSYPDDPPVWWAYDLGVGVAKVVERLTIKAPIVSAGHISIKDFVLEGSNNGTDWTTVYTGQAADSTAVQAFTFLNPTAYRHYRFSVLSTWAGAGQGVDLNEIEMMERSASFDYVLKTFTMS